MSEKSGSSVKDESGGTWARGEDYRVLRVAHFSLVPPVPLIPCFDACRALLAFPAYRARGCP